MNHEADELAIAAAQLKTANHKSWEEFVKALEGYYTIQRETLVLSSPDGFPKIQGRAQMLRDLLELFADPIRHAEQAKKRKTK